MGKVLDNKCPSCGAPIAFNPSIGKFKCDYCESEFTASELKDMDKINSEEVTDYDNYVTYNCPDCGASIVTDENTAATFCVYCGNYSIIKNRLSGEFAPSKIIPFKMDKDKAISAFKMLKKGRPLVPRDFVSPKNIEKITGVYIPFWLYNISVDGTIDAKGTRVKSWSSGSTRYTKTDFYKMTRTGGMKYHRVPVDGSTRFSNDIMNSIEPFDYNELIPYNHAYLSGFLAERYDVNSDDAFDDAKKRAINSTKEEMLGSMVNYSTKSVTSCDLSSSIDGTEYVLLPVWMVNVKYKDKYYLFAMNGESGEFIGDIPLDKGRAIIIGIITFIISFICIVIASYVLFKIGGN